MRVAVLLLALTAALSIWPCAAAPRSLEPEYVRIANAADARLENAVVQELTPPQAMPPSGSSYQNKCRSQRMRFGTQNLRGFRDKQSQDAGPTPTLAPRRRDRWRLWRAVILRTHALATRKRVLPPNCTYCFWRSCCFMLLMRRWWLLSRMCRCCCTKLTAKSLI